MISFLIDGRRAFFWIVFFLIALSANAFALVLQYGFDIQPCVKCIDQRIALYLVAISSLLAIIIPKHTFTFTLARIAALSSMAYTCLIFIFMSFIYPTCHLHHALLNQAFLAGSLYMNGFLLYLK